MLSKQACDGALDGKLSVMFGQATLSYFLERVWSIAVLKGSNTAGDPDLAAWIRSK